MTKKKFYASMGSFAALLLLLHNTAAQSLPPDTTAVPLSEVFITPDKEHATSNNAPAAATTLLGTQQIERDGISSPAALSAITPNFFMPSYGSKLTSAIYIRGVGSRMNESAVALYVDGAPYMDKSAFDFDFLDLAKVEAQRGPQGVLYGRNAMGGIVNVYTASPLIRQGTAVAASYGSASDIKASARFARKWGSNVGLSLGAAYHKTNGFYTNVYDLSPADAIETANARLRLDWKLSDRLRLSYVLSGEQSRQRGYAYGAVDSTGKVHDVNHNDPAGYERLMLVNSLTLRYEGEAFSVSSVSSVQLFDDHLKLDIDYSPANLFTLAQKQKQRAATEEIIVKSKSGRNYQWLFGAFGFYKKLYTEAPVNLKSGMIDQISLQLPTTPVAVSLVADSGSTTPADNIFIPSDFETSTQGFAAFHQSVYNNLFVDGLSLTAGLRLDYESVAMQYSSTSRLHTMTVLPPTMGGQTIWISSPRATLYDGNLSSDFLELLPKVALQYEFFGRKYRLYATAAKGYTAGGYNTNLFADLVQDKLQPEIVRGGVSFKPAEDNAAVKNIVYYKPEYSWNYELGGQASLLENRLQASAALFFVDTRDRQIAQFVPSGYGRTMKNAGRSSSYGAELQVGWRAKNLTANLAYGYTHATFTHYVDSTAAGAEVSYKGKFVPFAPRHTLSLGAEYAFVLNSRLIDRLTLAMLYTGAGKIYFTEANEDKASQDFYSLLNGKISLQKGIFRFGFWAKNLLNTGYKTFYFETMGNGFAQQGLPMQLGVEVAVAF
jgi:outer membrane receptor protein involved in Fe transport